MLKRVPKMQTHSDVHKHCLFLLLDIYQIGQITILKGHDAYLVIENLFMLEMLDL